MAGTGNKFAAHLSRRLKFKETEPFFGFWHSKKMQIIPSVPNSDLNPGLPNLLLSRQWRHWGHSLRNSTVGSHALGWRICVMLSHQERLMHELSLAKGRWHHEEYKQRQWLLSTGQDWQEQAKGRNGKAWINQLSNQNGLSNYSVMVNFPHPQFSYGLWKG